MKSPEGTRRQMTTNKCFCCLWRFNNSTTAPDQRKERSQKMCYCAFPCVFATNARSQIYVWKKSAYMSKNLYQAATWGDSDIYIHAPQRLHRWVCVYVYESVCVRERERETETKRVSIAHIIHHEARLTVIVMVASWRSLGPDTHTQTHNAHIWFDMTNHRQLLVIHGRKPRGAGNIQG